MEVDQQFELLDFTLLEYFETRHCLVTDFGRAAVLR